MSVATAPREPPDTASHERGEAASRLRVVLNVTAEELRVQAGPHAAPGRAVYHESLLQCSGPLLQIEPLPARPAIQNFVHRGIRKAVAFANGRNRSARFVTPLTWKWPVSTRLFAGAADVVHADLNFPWVYGSRLNVPVVWSAHGIVPEWCDYKGGGDGEALLKQTVKLCEYFARYASIVLSPTECGAAGLRRFTKIPHEKIRVVPIPFRGEPLPPRDVRASGTPFRVLFIGRDPVRKGLRELIAAHLALRQTRQEIELHIVGDPGVAASMAGGARAGIVVHGLCAREHVLRLMDAADALVVPTHAETFYLPEIEAMSKGLPVICTAIPPLTEVITDGVEGFLVPAANVDRIARAIQTLAERPEFAHQMGARGRQRVRAQFDPAAVLPRLRAVYQEAVDRHRRSPSLPC